jgi:hypothetical protein
MAQLRLDVLRVPAVGDQQACIGGTEVVKPDSLVRGVPERVSYALSEIAVDLGPLSRSETAPLYLVLDHSPEYQEVPHASATRVV